MELSEHPYNLIFTDLWVVSKPNIYYFTPGIEFGPVTSNQINPFFLTHIKA